MIGCVLTIGILIALFLLIGVLFFRFTINRFLENSRQRIISSCATLEQVQYSTPVTLPQEPGKYEYSVARALLDVSLKTTQSNCYNIIPIDLPPGFTEQDRVQGINPWSNRVEMFCIIFSNAEGKYLISFTGTMFPDEIMNDLNIRQIESQSLNNHVPGAAVHQGFYNVYMAVRPELWRKIPSDVKELYITGHSLGGALSTLCAFDFAQFNPVHYSFASPRVGNVRFAERYNQIVPQGIRVYNIEDSITAVPPPVVLGLVYEHVASGIAFDLNMGNLRDNHIQAYLNAMPQCVPYQGC